MGAKTFTERRSEMKSEKIWVDAATWGVVTMVACLGAASSQDWASGHGRLVGIASVLAVLGAGLKSFPTFTKPAA